MPCVENRLRRRNWLTANSCSLADQVFTGESFAVFPVYVFFPCSPMYVGKTGLAIGWACLPPRQGWGRSFRKIELGALGICRAEFEEWEDVQRFGGFLSRRVGNVCAGDKKRKARRSGERQESLGEKGCRVMKRRMWLAGVLVALLCAVPAKADTGVIIRTTGGLPALQILCLLPTTCTVVGALDGTLGQVFLVTTPLPLQSFLGLLPGGLTGFVDAEVDQLLNLVGPILVPASISATLMSDRASVPYGATSVWNSYANQTASGIVEVQNAQKSFIVTGTGIVADIDTGVDPNHPVLQPVLVLGNGYDF